MATYKINATITVEGVRSRKEALNTLQIMLDDFEDMNPDTDASVCIHIEKIKKETTPTS